MHPEAIDNVPRNTFGNYYFLEFTETMENVANFKERLCEYFATVYFENWKKYIWHINNQIEIHVIMINENYWNNFYIEKFSLFFSKQIFHKTAMIVIDIS